MRSRSPSGGGATSRRAARWLDAGLLDVEFYAALRGREFEGADQAAVDFVSHGMPARLSPHPFLDFVSLPPEIRRAWRDGKVGPVLEHLTDEDGAVRPTGPLARPADPEAARTAMLGLARQLGREAAGVSPVAPPSVDWLAAKEKDRRPDLTSVVVVATDARRTIRTVQQLLERSGDIDVEVVVVDCGSPPHAALGLLASLQECAGAELLRLPKATPAPIGTNLGVVHANGTVVVLLDEHVVVRRGWLAPLLEPLTDPDVAGAQPLLLRADDTIDSAGLVVTTEDLGPTPLLAGHQKEDARRLEGHRLVAISGEVMALRTADIVAVEGLHPRDSRAEEALDLCARLLPRHQGGFRVAPTALATVARNPDGSHVGTLPVHPLLRADPQLHERIGFVAEATAAGPVVTGLRDRAPDELRWSLKLPSGAGPWGDRWGDTHFADALAGALRDLGQDVVTCRRGAHASGPTHLDEVSVALRGLYPIPPMPGQVNALWVISHPDDVDPREFDGYDLVFAASHPWSQAMSLRAGREVIPLLQATEFGLPPDADSATTAEAGVVFVGAASPERERPLVWKAVEAGVPLAVYGPGWESLPDGIWRGAYVDNRSLPELYHRYGIVLADHWPDMARHGFIANRVFDAVASGARAICDDVVGVHEVFHPRDVVVVRTPEEIAAAVAELGRAASDVARPALSFHDRARTLLDRALPLVQSSAGGRRG